MYVETSKNEDTWYKMLWHSRCRIKFNPEIFRRVVAQMASYTILQNSNGNRYVLYLYWNDGKWNWNYNWLDNKWNANNPSAVLATVSFLSRYGRVLFCKLTIPSAKHFSNLVKRHRKSYISFVINRFTFPEDKKKYFYCV